MLKVLLLLFLPSICFSYPELLSKKCASCHSESSGAGILTTDGKNHALDSSYRKTESYFEIKTPEWLLLGAKADLKQVFRKTPYEETGSFKATRAEAQLGLSHNLSSYLNASAQGSINRVEPQTKSDSISDYTYSPYRFISLDYSDKDSEILTFRHGYYRNEWQNYFSEIQTSFQQSEITYTYFKHQVSLGYINKSKTYNSTTVVQDGFINYKFLEINHYSLLLAHQWGKQFQLSNLGLVVKKSDSLTFKAFISQTISSDIKGVQASFSPIYQLNSYLKFYGFAEYKNTNIKTAKPRAMIYGFGTEYLWFSQGLLGLVYSKTDDSNLINNPTEKLELNFHLYM